MTCDTVRLVLITIVLSWWLLLTFVAFFFVGFSRCAERSAQAPAGQDTPLPEPCPTGGAMPRVIAD